MTPTEAAQWYREERPKYERLTQKTKNLLEDLLEKEGLHAIIESRTKNIISFEEKCQRKSYTDPAKQATDLAALRLILPTIKDAEATGQIIWREFEVDMSRSGNKFYSLQANEFGYLSEHFVVQTRYERRHLVEWADYANLNAEIQVRTVLQHAWAQVEHSLNYKAKIDIPANIRRQFYRLSAVFELADEQFQAINDRIAVLTLRYTDLLDERGADIEVTYGTLIEYYENSPTAERWRAIIKEIGVNVSLIGQPERTQAMAKKAGITTLRQLDKVLRAALDWGVDYFQRLYGHILATTPTAHLDMYKNRPMTYSDISTDNDGIISSLLIETFPETFTDEVLTGFGMRRSAVHHQDQGR